MRGTSWETSTGGGREGEPPSLGKKAKRPLGQAPACQRAVTELLILVQAAANLSSPWVPAFSLPAELLSVGFCKRLGLGARDVGEPISHTHAISLSPFSAIYWEAWRRTGSQLVEPGSWSKDWHKGLASKSFGKKGPRGAGMMMGGRPHQPLQCKGILVEGGKAWLGDYQRDLDLSTKNLAASRPESNPRSAICQL